MKQRVKQQPQNDRGKTALYCRLSQEDDQQGDSNSIQNQRAILEKYAADHGFGNTDFYVDDGYSGTNFNRPDFQRMLSDIEMGLVGAVITKDLSRLGRNYLEVGRYIEIVFPEYGVRYIAINDQVDSINKDSNDLMPFRNVFNEWFARDTSKKIRAVVQSKYAKGERVAGNPPYGYLMVEKSLVVNPDTAPIVRQIYALCMEGLGPSRIAHKLTEQGIFNPVAYHHQRTGVVYRGSALEIPTHWSEETVSHILANQEYIGDTVLGRTVRRSYKDKRRIDLPRERQHIFENTHEAIIDRETWETVQRIRTGKRRCDKLGEKDKFSGLAVCADCGKPMYNARARHLKLSEQYFMCGFYRRHTRMCTSHYIRTVVLEQMVLDNLRQVLSVANGQADAFRRYVLSKAEQEQQQAVHEQRREMEKAQQRVAKLDVLIQKLFESYATDSISRERFTTLSAGYEAEQQELKRRLSALSEEVQVYEEESANAERFLHLARKYTDLRELTPTILRELVSKIVVSESEKLEGIKRRQKIQIHYNFIGSLDMPKADEVAESA